MGVSHKPHPQSSLVPSTALDTPARPLQHVHTHSTRVCVCVTPAVGACSSGCQV